MTNADFLRGPWQAVLADIYGWVYTSIEDAVDNADDELDYSDFRIFVVRGSAAPSISTGRGRMPTTYDGGDVAHECDDFQLVGLPFRPNEGGEARWAQAQAMAAGLNAAGAA